MPSLAPERVGRYEIVSLLGEGGMARVYLAVLRGPADFNKLGVIKQIRPELAWDKEFIRMFLDEARLAARLNHSNVVQTYQVVKDQGSYNLAMEYLEGQPLSEILEPKTRKGILLEEYLWILSQVLAGLQYAHTLTDYDGKPLGIVHRDVCPANVFVTYNGDVKLLDFGIAKASGALSATREGMFKGRLGYCAPEQLQGLTPDARIDIFAVGVMLWEVLAGRRITEGFTSVATAQARIAGEELKIRDVCPQVAPKLADMCDRAMALDPEDRYPSAAAFQRDIDGYLDRHPRRVRRTQLAERLQVYFERERRETRKRIEEQLAVPFDAGFASESWSMSSLLQDLPTSIDYRAPGPAPKARPSRSRRLAVAAAVVVGGFFGASASWRLIHPPVRPATSLVPFPAPTTIGNPPKLVPAKVDATPTSSPPETIYPEERSPLKQDSHILNGSAVSRNSLQADGRKRRGLGRAQMASVPHKPVVNRTHHARQGVDHRRKHLVTRDWSKHPLPQEQAKPRLERTQALEPGMSLSHPAASRTPSQLDETNPYSP
jgi:serine/threonine protein kinase